MSEDKKDPVVEAQEALAKDRIMRQTAVQEGIKALCEKHRVTIMPVANLVLEGDQIRVRTGLHVIAND